MSGSVFKRCTRCGARVPDRRCEKCGADSPSWAFTVDVGTDARRRRKQWARSGFGTKKAAEHALRELLTSLDQRRYVEPRRLTLETYWSTTGCRRGSPSSVMPAVVIAAR